MRVEPRESYKRSSRAPLKDSDGRYICYSCNQPGHTSRYCPQNREKQPGLPVDRTTTVSSQHGDSTGVDMSASIRVQSASSAVHGHQVTSQAFGNCLVIEVKIAGVITRCLLDTGSEVTTITESYFREHFCGVGSELLSARWVRLTAANGLEIPVVGCLETDVECMGQTLCNKCVFVLKDPEQSGEVGVPGIVGMNILGDLKGLLGTHKEVTKLDRHRGLRENACVRRVLATIEKETNYIAPSGRIGYVKVAGRRKVTIPPYTQVIVQGRCRTPIKSQCQVLVEATTGVSLPSGVLVANVLTQAKEGKVPVRILNATSKIVRLPPRARLAEVHKPAEIYLKDPIIFEEQQDALCVWVKTEEVAGHGRLSDPLPISVEVNMEPLQAEQTLKLRALLEKHIDVFSKSDSDYGHTTAVTHCIPTGDAQPIKQRHRRIPPQVFQEVK